MSLHAEDRRSIVAYRMERADATLEEARGVAEREWYNLAANRLYYASYYAASALLISDGIPARTHSGVISQVNLHYVKTGKLAMEYGALLGQLFSLRQSGDYEDFKRVTKEQFDELAPKTIELVETLKKLVSINI